MVDTMSTSSRKRFGGENSRALKSFAHLKQSPCDFLDSEIDIIDVILHIGNPTYLYDCVSSCSQ